MKTSAAVTPRRRIGARVMAWAGAWARAWVRAPQRRPLAHLARQALSRLHIRNVRVLRLQARFCTWLGWPAAAAFCEGKALQLDIVAPLAAQDLTAVLPLMAGFERTRRAAPLAAGQLIAEALITAPGRADLLQAAQAARTANADSAYLAHLVTLCQARQGDYRAASADLAAALALPWRADDPLERQRFAILRDTWRVVDMAAREQMDWAHSSEGYADLLEGGTPAPAGPADDQPDERILNFKEHALQGRQRAAYLAACEADLAQARSLAERLKAITEMLRPSLRHIPSYTASYDLGRGHLLALRPQWEDLFDRALRAETAEQTILDLCSLLQLTRQLGLQDDSARCLARLQALAETDSWLAFLWPAADVIAAQTADLPLANRIMAAITARHSPQTSRDVKNYFHWALLAGAHAAAHATHAALPARLRAQAGLLQYVQILQREGRFDAAMALTRAIHAQALTDPVRLNAFSNASLIKRRGELAFLIETAAILGRHPQPQDPKGVILIAPRNVDQLRRYPLMVLAEMKREGWAVVPLVSGLLPVEKTGNPQIDLLNGAISPNIRFSAQTDAALPAITGFAADPRQGRLQWGDMDMSHLLWEEAAINRRRYTIDWECPGLQVYLGNLCDWTVAMGRCLDHARALHQSDGMRFGAMALFNSRLPDGLFRFYCAAHGDAEGFFCLHAANGYQNYFTNFSTNLSQRFVLRNMTRHPDARSASFPLPQNFARYVDAHRAGAPAILQRFAGITAVKRSTKGQTALPPEAEAVRDQITAWKARGGRVACAFGKVVCDSAVPFDGGPAHASMQDWINHCIAAVQGSDTLLLIKPHPHELNNQIATFPTEYFADLLTEPLGANARLLGHRWFDIADLRGMVDLGLIYNGTTAVELGIMGIPCVLAGHFAPTDYPIGHAVPRDRAHFTAMLRGDAPVETAPDLTERAALWLDYMSSEDFTLPYGYHVRPVTNTVLYPPWWVAADLERHDAAGGDPAVTELMGRALGWRAEPGGVVAEA